MNRKQQEKELLDNELITWTEKNFGHLKPHLPVILTCSGLIVVICILWVYYQDLNKKNQAMPWNDFNMAVSQTRLSGDTRVLTAVADAYPENMAGMWALQLAADFELRSGISQFGTDEISRKEGLDKVRKALVMYQRIVDSPIEKSAMLQRRSLYGLAYASETVGDFDNAKNHYQSLIVDGSESPFLDAAKRGEVRTSDPEYLALFDKFRDWKDTPGDAPGPVLPPRPDIGFPSGDSTGTNFGGGAFEPVTPAATPDDGTPATQGTDSSGEAEKPADAETAKPDTGNQSGDAEAKQSEAADKPGNAEEASSESGKEGG
ncbi:MAG: hypothetical protein MK108_09140 [Mariniblastus sp.]|nr:hypothetical protein [Mariniblastus sp.]